MPGHTTLVLAALLLGATTRQASAQQEFSLAAPVLTLDDAIALALKGNYSVANATLGVSKSAATVSAIKTLHLPILNLGGDLVASIRQDVSEMRARAVSAHPGLFRVN